MTTEQDMVGLIDYLRDIQQPEEARAWAKRCIKVIQVMVSSKYCMYSHDHLKGLGMNCEYHV